MDFLKRFLHNFVIVTAFTIGALVFTMGVFLVCFLMDKQGPLATLAVIIGLIMFLFTLAKTVWDKR